MALISWLDINKNQFLVEDEICPMMPKFDINIDISSQKQALNIISQALSDKFQYQHNFQLVQSCFHNQFFFNKLKMQQMYFEDSQFFLGNMFEDYSSSNTKEYILFSKFYSAQCENELLNSIQPKKNLSSEPANQIDSKDLDKYFSNQLSKTQAEEPVQEIFRTEEQEQKKKGSTDCQNSPKLMSKVICQLFKSAQSMHYFSDQARQYACFGINKLKKNPTIDSLAQFLAETPQELKEQRKRSASTQKFNFSLLELDLKKYQAEVRAFIIQRRQECLKMAAKREIKDFERLKCFIKYVEAFIENLVGGVVKRKLKKF